MTAPPLPEIIPGLSAIAGRYDVLLCDVWGVIHNGREAFDGACEALARFAATRGPVVLISNAPRPSSDVVSQLDSLGVPRSAWSGFVTSGDATRALRSGSSPNRDTPVIAVTASSTPKDWEACRAAGMNGHLGKPIKADDLFDAVLADDHRHADRALMGGHGNGGVDLRISLRAVDRDGRTDRAGSRRVGDARWQQDGRSK